MMSMKNKATPPQYLHISLDLATRIAEGDLPEGSQMYGRSVLASEYNVSPETIRRSLHLLADMKVVTVKPRSGAVVLSRDNARRYIENFTETIGVDRLQDDLKEMVAEYDALNRRMKDTVAALVQSREMYMTASQPLPNYQISVPQNSPLIGKSIGGLNFWQSTGATIVAIRRGANVILSPGPYAEIYGGDTVIFVGDEAAVKAAAKFIGKEEPYDKV